ncbi:MAG: ribonuclease HII [Arcanobacterium sp.]|nr:ribonuclease HII [Arcanobacterium sp.]
MHNDALPLAGIDVMDLLGSEWQSGSDDSEEESAQGGNRQPLKGVAGESVHRRAAPRRVAQRHVGNQIGQNRTGQKKPALRVVPSRDIEREWLAELGHLADTSGHTEASSHELVLAGVDEVGRGALAGPVSVGIATVTAATSDSFPAGLRDSKMLTPTAREALIAPCEQWVQAWAVGSASPHEIDRFGIIEALRIAAARATRVLADRGIHIDGVLLDGTHNWWTPTGLFEIDCAREEERDGIPELPDVPVRMVVKGDAHCAVIAAASVLAKVTRDSYMVDIAQRYPGYSFECNKGYASAAHRRALIDRGPTEIHRISWHLPGVR